MVPIKRIRLICAFLAFIALVVLISYAFKLTERQNSMKSVLYCNDCENARLTTPLKHSEMRLFNFDRNTTIIVKDAKDVGDFECEMDKLLEKHRLWHLSVIHGRSNNDYARKYSLTTRATEDERDLFDALYKMQFPRDCSKAEFTGENTIPYSQNVEWPLNYALDWKKTIVLDRSGSLYTKLCLEMCTLRFSSCTNQDVERTKEGATIIGTHDLSLETKLGDNFNTAPPHPWHKHTKLWWVSLTGAFMMYPNCAMRERINSIVEDMRSAEFLHGRTNCIFMNVEPGNIWHNDKQEFLNFSDYMEVAQKLVDDGLASRKVFLMNGIPEISQYKDNFTFYSAKSNNDGNSSRLDMNILSQVHAGVNMCKYFIGTGSSNIGRLVLEMMVYKYGEKTVMDDTRRWTSLDGSWDRWNTKY
jgi:hypothetical protein